ncbi:MAG: hypothetical protein ACLQGP_17770 [Isosphaeraceae bacterium]
MLIWNRMGRQSRRRMILIAMAGGLSVLAFWWYRSDLFPLELAIAGKWTVPWAQVSPRGGFVTSSGKVTNSWMVWHFRPDRSFRVWIVSADDPKVQIPHMEGRWRVSEGELSLDDLGAWGWFVREVRERVGVRFGIPNTGRVQGKPKHRLKLVDPDTLELGPSQGKPITLKRRP